MMTLRLKKCVSLFVCLSLLLSACSPGKSSKAGGFVRSAACLSGLVVSPLPDKSSKASELARNTVKLAYNLCSEKGTVTVDAGKSIEFIGEMKCTTENGKTTCKEGDKIKCELEKVELCNDLGKDCKDFEFGETPVPCEPSDKSKGACRPMSLRATKQEEGAKEGTKKEQEQEKREEIVNEIDGLCSTDECKNDVKIIKGLLKEVADITKSISELFREELDKGKSANDRTPSIGQGESSLDGGGVGKSVLDNKPNPSANARNIKVRVEELKWVEEERERVEAELKVAWEVKAVEYKEGVEAALKALKAGVVELAAMKEMLKKMRVEEAERAEQKERQKREEYKKELECQQAELKRKQEEVRQKELQAKKDRDEKARKEAEDEQKELDELLDLLVEGEERQEKLLHKQEENERKIQEQKRKQEELERKQELAEQKAKEAKAKQAELQCKQEENERKIQELKRQKEEACQKELQAKKDRDEKACKEAEDEQKELDELLDILVEGEERQEKLLRQQEENERKIQEQKRKQEELERKQELAEQKAKEAKAKQEELQCKQEENERKIQELKRQKEEARQKELQRKQEENEREIQELKRQQEELELKELEHKASTLGVILDNELKRKDSTLSFILDVRPNNRKYFELKEQLRQKIKSTPKEKRLSVITDDIASLFDTWIGGFGNIYDISTGRKIEISEEEFNRRVDDFFDNDINDKLCDFDMKHYLCYRRQ